MSHHTEVLVVSESPPQSGVSLLESSGFTGCVRAPEAALSAFTETPPDCLVVCEASIPAALAAAASEAGCPIVDCVGTVPETRGGCEIQQTDEAESSLPKRVETAVNGTPNHERIARLHAGSAELLGIEDRETLHQRIVDIGSEVLDFGTTVLYLRDEDGFHLAASTDPNTPPYADDDFGILSHVYETKESVVIDDITAHPIAEQRVDKHRSGVAVPFGDIGVLGGLSAARGSYDEADLEFSELLANHGAQVDARFRAEEDLGDRQARITRLHEAAPSLINAESQELLYNRIAGIAEDVLELDQSALLVERDGELTPVAGRTDKFPAISSDAGILGRTYQEQRSFLVTNAQANADATPIAEMIRSALSVPVGDVGVFQAFSTETGMYDETDLELAELLVGYAEATLNRMRSEESLRQSRQTIKRLHDTAMDLGAAETEAALLDHAIEAAEEILALDKCEIDILDDDLLVPVAKSSGTPPDAPQTMHISEGVAGKTARTGRSFRFDDIENDPDSAPASSEFHSALSVPIGEIGVFQAVSSEIGVFDQEDVDFVELLMAHVAVSLGRVRAEDDLRTQRDSLDALFENIPGAAVSYEMIDQEPIVRRVNGAFERTFGYTAEEVTDNSLDEFIVPPEEANAAQSYNSKIAAGERVHVEVERQTADGPKPFLLQVTPLEVGEENAPGYAIYSDMTEQRQRESELRQQNERLEQFASVVSHDLRNPLNVASGYLDIVRETGETEKLDQVEDALDRMDQLVTDLLRLAREGRDVGDTHRVGVDTVAQEAWGHAATDEASIQIETDQSLFADRDRLVELFENLYRNAAEHAIDTPTVTVGELAPGDGFFVADDGPGIDDEIDPFDTGVTTTENGTGFGLPIVESIAEAHGWSVSITESESGGARFEFALE